MRLLWLPLLFLSSPLWAQNETLSLDHWRAHTGDEPAFARAEFDDSDWKVSGPPQFKDAGGRVDSGKVTWFRTSVRTPSWWRGQQLSLGMGPVGGAYQVFVDGVEVGHFGVMPSPGVTIQGDSQVRRYMPGHHSYSVSNQAVRGESTEVAIRVWFVRHRLQQRNLMGGDIQSHPPVLGLTATVTQGEEIDLAHGFLRLLPSNLLWLLIFGCGLFCVWLYPQWPAEKQLLWLGLALSFNGGLRLTTLPISLNMVPANSISAFALTLGTSFWIHFFYCWLLAELVPPFRRAIRRAAPLISFASLLLFVKIYYPIPISDTGAFWGTEAGALSQALLGAFALWHCATRRQWDMALVGGGVALRAVLNMLVNTGGALSDVQIGPVTLPTSTFGNAILAVALAGILYARYRRRSARQHEAEQDIAAARRVQEGLLAAEQLDYPGFEVDRAYEPAREVGGDFYQLIPAIDGSLLVVTGDVSGKGLQAAMLVATVIGALGDLESRQPELVLRHLNRSLYGRARGGFITCCCALFHADGRIELANAGHVPPYRDREEISFESGLPLGVARDAEYSQTVVKAQGGKLTFVSDGVVEAARPNGDLFGFERTCEISGKSAREIADAARAWGQNDDITVVTVRRLEFGKAAA